MNDQALRLRQLAADQVSAPPVPDGPPVIVVGSGKGGVGKSVFAALAAFGLGRSGRRVLLLDGSQNLGHLPVLVGVEVHTRLEQVARGDLDPEAILHQVDDRLWLAPSDSGAEGLYALGSLDSARLQHRLSSLYHRFEAVVVDAGPGVENVVRLATMGGTRLVVVTVPEVTALTDAYALIKLVDAQLPILPIDLVANRAESDREGRLAYDRLAEAARRFLGRRIGWLGTIADVPALRAAMRRPGALLSDPSLEDLRHRVSLLALGLLGRVEGATP
jgi:flagellar biosynthesis protein FlhG